MEGAEGPDESRNKKITYQPTLYPAYTNCKQQKQKKNTRKQSGTGTKTSKLFSQPFSRILYFVENFPYFLPYFPIFASQQPLTSNSPGVLLYIVSVS